MQMRGDDANPRQHACITVSLSRLTLLGRKSGGCEDPSFWSVKYRSGYLLPLKDAGPQIEIDVDGILSVSKMEI